MALKPAGLALTLLVVAIAMLILAWVTVVARICVRKWIKGLGLDDYLMCFGLLLHTILIQCVITATHYGVGTPDDQLNNQYFKSGRMWLFFCQVFYCLATIPIKCSICVGLLRIAVQSRYRYPLYAIMIMSTLSVLITVSVLLAWCRPVAATWDPSLGQCADPALITNVSYFISSISIATDWACAILPAFLLWDIQLRTAVKVSLIVVLALGVVASSATIIRLGYLVAYTSPVNYLQGVARISIWSIAETGIGIAAGSLPSLRPLLRFIPGLRSIRSNNYATPTARNRTNFTQHSHQLSTIDRHPARNVPEVEERVPSANRTGSKVEVEGGFNNRMDNESERHILKDITVTVVQDDASTASQKAPSERNAV